MVEDVSLIEQELEIDPFLPQSGERKHHPEPVQHGARRAAGHSGAPALRKRGQEHDQKLCLATCVVTGSKLLVMAG